MEKKMIKKSISAIIIIICFVNVFASCQKRGVEWVSTTFEKPWQVVSTENLSSDPAADVIEIDTSVSIGDIEGFGSCFNELGWASLSMLTQEERDAIFNELYTPEGANSLNTMTF